MKILVLGATGQVALALRDRNQTHDITFLDRTNADFCDPPALTDAVKHTSADVIIIAAAYTAVDRAETEIDIAEQVNHHAVATIASAAAARAIPVLHLSTDYVFPGNGTTPWRPTDAPGPLGVYGGSKLRGERALMAAGGKHIILRTSWVFSAHGNNFVKTMLRLGGTRDTLNVVDDQIGGPTAADDIADVLLRLAVAIQPPGAPNGLYHFCGFPSSSWAEFAVEIFRQSQIDCAVHPIATADYPTPAKRPLNSRLDCASLAADYGIEQPDWRKSLHQTLIQLGAIQ